ncbi:MAG TPA: GLUG motif-containing protein [Rhizomicrobium sp.]|jgi:hypothetical protein
MSCAAGICAPTATKAVLNIGDLENLLASGNIEVATTGSGGVQARDITIAGAVSWSNASSLTLDAYRSIIVNKPVLDAGNGGVSLVTNDGGSGGLLSFRDKGSLSFGSSANSLNINGSAYTLSSSVKALAADIAGNPSGSYALSTNYDAAADGVYSASPIATNFQGTFNGLGNTISHLAIHGKVKGQYLGLFTEVESTGTVGSVRFEDAVIKAAPSSVSAVVAGVNYGTVFNAFAHGKIGGGAGEDTGVFGGVVGYNAGTIKQSGASVAIVASGQGRLGFAIVGGLVASNEGTVEQSFAVGPVAASTGRGLVIGGLVGINDIGVIDNCYATGATSGGGPGNVAVGGIVGENALTIESSYSEGAPTGGAESVVGGSIGYDLSATHGGVLSALYWDTTTSDITNLSQGAGNIANDPGIAGKTTARLQARLPAGFDPSIWAENPGINGGLPYLIANPPQ